MDTLRHPIVQTILVAATLLLTGVVYAATPNSMATVRKSLPGEACLIGPDHLPVGWSASEKWAWAEICEGRIADFNRLLGEALDPRKPSHNAKWSDGRRSLSSEFLEAVLLHEPYRSAVPYRGVRIVGAFFEQGITLSDALLMRPLVLHRSQFEGPVSLSRVKTENYVSFNESRVKGKLDFDSARLGGNLMMKNAEFSEVRLTGSRIDGQLSMDGSSFGGLLQMDYLTVRGSLLMIGAEFSEVRFRAGNTDARLSLAGSTFNEILDMELVSVGESLLMRDAVFADVNVTGAKIIGQVSIEASSFTGSLKMSSMAVGQGIYVGGRSSFAEVVLRGTKVGGQLSLRDSTFAGHLAMDSVSVGQGTYLQKSTFADVLLDGARLQDQLVVRQTKVNGSLSMDTVTVGRNVYLTDRSHFDGLVDMEALIVEGNLELKRSQFGEVHIKGAHIQGWAWLEDSMFSGFLQMDSIAVSESLYMRGAQFAKVGLKAAKVGGQISLNASKFHGQLDLASVTVGGELLMSDGASFADVVLAGAEIGGQLAINGSKFSGPLNLESVSVGAHLLMREAEFQSVNLVGANAAGTIEMHRSNFYGVLKMEALKAGGSLLMREGVFDGVVNLVHAVVDSNLDVGGATIGILDLRGARIAGELRLGSTRFPMNWKESRSEKNEVLAPRLNLQNATAHLLQDTPNTWTKSLEWELEGFTYTGFGGLAMEPGESPFDRGSDWFVQWLDGDETFSPQPFRQLAKVLRETGHDPLADAVLFALQDRIRNLDSTAGWDAFLLWVSRAMLGYGYRVWWALAWFGGLVLIGFCVLCLTPAGRQTSVSERLLFSLGAAVPLTGFSSRQVSFSKEVSPGVDGYFVFHRILGLIIVSVLIAGMTGLVS